MTAKASPGSPRAADAPAAGEAALPPTAYI